jgi:serine/threonine-protein kinase
MQIEQLGPYRIGRKLGLGGMGTVYEGVHVETGEPAAVKLLAETLVHEPDFRHRFEAEIEALRKLNHPHIVRLFGFGQQGEHLFYAMELVDGSSLEKELGRGRVFSWREVLRIGIELARALRHAHDRGVIHRDIKPSNLLLTAEGEVKLSDFGIARLFGSRGHTTVGSVLGTAEFMSPEQADGRAVSPRSDLYSLGGVLYVLLTRRPLFRGKSLPEILLKQRLEQPTPVGELAPDVPAELQQVIHQLLAKDPEGRIPTAEALVRRLEAIDRELAALLSSSPAISLPPVTPEKTAAPASAAVSSPDGLAPTVVTENLPPPAAAAGGAETEFAAPLPPRPAPPADTIKPPGRFTVVGKEELDRGESPLRRAPFPWLQTAALAISLAAIAVAVAWFLQPPNADGLFQRIEARARRNDPDALRQAADDIDDFVRRFPQDARCRRVRHYQQEIDLENLQRKFDRRTRGLGADQSLLPVEQAYLDALSYARLDPERGMAKFQALIDLYGDHPAPSGHAAQCLELARRQLARLKEQFDAPAADRLKLLMSRLDEAERLRAAEPERARAMYRAVIELYGGKPWAAEAVGRARAALATEKKPSAPASEYENN